MATPNRAALIKKTLRVLRKHFEVHTPAKDRSLLENLLFACLLENSNHDTAERAFGALQKDYFDLNEIRVSTVRELAESFRGLNDAEDAAHRLKRTLHSVFESVYSFDLEPLKKQNIGQAVKTIDRYDGTTPFIVGFVTQSSLGGHAIPANNGLLIAFEAIGVITEAEAKKGIVPGLERAVPKSKGVEAASLLHQLGVEVGRSPYGAVARKLLLEIEPDCRERLPKRPAKPSPVEEVEEPPPATRKTKKSGKKSGPQKAEDVAEKKKPATSKHKLSKNQTPEKKKTARKKQVAAKKKERRKTSSRLSKKKPR